MKITSPTQTHHKPILSETAPFSCSHNYFEPTTLASAFSNDAELNDPHTQNHESAFPLASANNASSLLLYSGEEGTDFCPVSITNDFPKELLDSIDLPSRGIHPSPTRIDSNHLLQLSQAEVQREEIAQLFERSHFVLASHQGKPTLYFSLAEFPLYLTRIRSPIHPPHV